MHSQNRYAPDTGMHDGQSTGGAPCILIVDDHALVRHGLALALKQRYPGAALLEAGSLAEALKRVRAEDGLSVVLYDLQMGDADGLPGVEAMLEVLGDVPLLVISATLDAATITACIRAGARGFLPKGCDPALLDQALPIVMGGGIYAPAPPANSAAPPERAAAPPLPSPRESAALEGLTLRQREVLKLLLEGRSNKEIARSLGVLEGTVKVHLRTVMLRLGVRNRTQLALFAARAGMNVPGTT